MQKMALVPEGRLKSLSVPSKPRSVQSSRWDGPIFLMIPGTSCLATIVLSLRDKNHAPIEAPRPILAFSSSVEDDREMTLNRYGQHCRPFRHLSRGGGRRPSQEANVSSNFSEYGRCAVHSSNGNIYDDSRMGSDYTCLAGCRSALGFGLRASEAARRRGDRRAFGPESNAMLTSAVKVERTESRTPKPAGFAVHCFLWFLMAAGLAYLSSAQADPYQQCYFSIGLLAVFFVFKYVNPARRAARIFFLAIATFIVLRYLFWRVLYTIEFTDWVSFTCAIVLFLAELYGIVVFLIGNFVNVCPITRPPARLPPPEDLPSVDVFVPTYNENLVVLEATLLATLQMRYPAGESEGFSL